MKKLLKTNIPILLLGLFIFSCHPARIVQKQDTDIEKLKQQFSAEKQAAAAEAVFNWIKDHPSTCPEINLDSVCSLYYQNSGSPFDYTRPDSVISTIAKPITQDSGHSTVVRPGGQQKPRYIYSPYEDTRKVNLYLDSIYGKQKTIEILNQVIADQRNAFDEQLKSQKKDDAKDEWFWKKMFFGLLILEGIRLILKYKVGLKFIP